MQLRLNSQPIDTPEGLRTVGEVVGYVEEERLPSQHVITKIVLDGDEVTGQVWDNGALDKDATDTQLEIYSARGIDVAREGLSDASQLLPQILEELPLAASDLTSGNEQLGLERFSRCMEVVSWYVTLLGAAEYILTSEGVPDIEIEGQGPGEELSLEDAVQPGWSGQDDGLLSFASVENLRQKLLDMQLAGSQDAKQLSHAISYEIKPIVEIWTRELPTIVSRIARLGNIA